MAEDDKQVADTSAGANANAGPVCLIPPTCPQELRQHC
jgi:hypothetical protein